MTSDDSTDETTPETTPESTTRSFLDPDAPFGSSGLIAAVIISGALTLAWWAMLHAFNCGIDAGGGPPSLPAPSTFGRNDLLYLLAGLTIAPLPLVGVRLFDKNTGPANIALQGAIVCALVISYLGLRHYVVGPNFWVEAC